MTILIASLTIYLVIVGVFMCALLFPYGKEVPLAHSTSRTVSIILAARNEQENISNCLDSLINLSFPLHLLEIIIVDDLSTDRTAEIVTEYAGRYTQVRLINSSTGNSALTGKVKALTAGIAVASGEIILVTDADCILPHTWISEMIRYFDDANVGIVAGFTSIAGTDVFSRIQAIDWFTLVSLASASARLAMPSTAVGNNLSFRRTAYDKVGGYEQIPFSVTEDLALVRAVVSKTEYRLAFSPAKESMVTCEPCVTWKEWYNQRTRWFIGGKSMSLTSKLIFLAGYLTNVGIIYLFVVGGWILPSILLAAKILLETLLVLPALWRSSRTSLLAIVPLYQTYFILYVLILPVLTAFRRTVSWKGRIFK
jgi:cellulose synthase/poly-beta-1,6-N-acetylglucosamine synthase-like glycosyltransferase